MNRTYKNTALPPKERAQLLLQELSLDEKMAQLNCVFPFGEVANDFTEISARVPYGIGEVSTLEMRRIQTLEDAAAWQRRVQTIVMENSPHGIPAIFHMEGLCGAFIQDTTSFPAGIGRGCSFDTELEEKIAAIVSRQEAACGITHVLAPVLDVARDPRMGRTGESYGEDPMLVAAMGAAYTRGIQAGSTAGRKTESVAKHFLGFHNAEGGIHGAYCPVPSRTLEEIYGKPFQASITESNLMGIMPCYCTINGEPASVSYDLLTDLLRGKMDFEGVCVSDYGGIENSYLYQRVGETLGKTGLLALEAGMDVEMPGISGYGEELKAMFASGEADMEVLDRAVLRVLTAKFRMGLFEHPFALEAEELKQAVIQPDDREVSLQSARESLVLLKNDGVLPIKIVPKKIAVIGPHAAFARKMFGGYTHMCMMESTYAIANSIAGVSGVVQVDPESIVTVLGTNIQSDETPEFDAILKRQKPDCRSLLEELSFRMEDTEILYAYGYPIWGEDQSGFNAALEASRQADLVILTLGGKHGTCSMASMGEGVDATNINLPQCQDSFILEVKKLEKPVIGVHFDGRPISSDIADEHLNAILECWSPSETGAEAVVDALVGKVSPSGKLTLTVARNAGQIPVYYNHFNNSSWHQSGSIGFANYVDLPHTPRYPFGYGLSYTNFEYCDLHIEKPATAPDEDVVITVKIKNTGDRAGTEIVQMYLRDEYASMVRPVKELAGFARVELQPGEAKEVTFRVNPSQMAFLDRSNRWKIEQGEISVQIGASSEDIRSSGSFTIENNQYLQSPERKFWAKAEVR